MKDKIFRLIALFKEFMRISELKNSKNDDETNVFSAASIAIFNTQLQALKQEIKDLLIEINEYLN